MNYSFNQEAEAEFEAAVDFYEECEAGLGETFSEEVEATIGRILRFPKSWPKYSLRSRRCLCSRFPFSIIYRISEDEIRIYAVMHQKRKPGYWKDRA